MQNPVSRQNFDVLFALFGLAEGSELDADVICREMWNLAERLLEVKLNEA